MLLLPLLLLAPAAVPLTASGYMRADSAPADEDLSWLQQHAQDLLRDLLLLRMQQGGGGSNEHGGSGFRRAADEGRPVNYLAPRAADLAFLVHDGADVLTATVVDGEAASSTAVASTLSLLAAAADHPPEELPARAWLLAGVANLTSNHSLLCSALPPLWGQLGRLYANASAWRDGLSFATDPRVAAVETVLSSGHDTLLSVLHYRALVALATSAEEAGCAADVAPMRAVQHAIAAALNQGPLLWNDTVGMFMPSSGNNAHLTDVWGSALAVDSGAVTGERAARIVAWFGAHWAEVVQDGQVRHLPARDDASGMPAEQYWPQTTTWQYGTYANGGYWAEASGWVLPVIARANGALGQKLLRDAIHAAQRDGSLREWQNTKFCCNCEGAATQTALCMTPYPSTASLSGVERYGRSVFSVYSAAKRLLGAHNPANGARASAEPPPTYSAPPPVTTTLHAQATAAMARKQPLAPGVDPDMAWLTEYATMYQAQARECTGCTGCVQPPYDGCFFPPAADPGRPAAYSELWTRDFEYTMEFLYPLFDETSRQAALDQTLYILHNRPAGNCSARPHHTTPCTNDEPMFQTKLVVNLANYTNNKTLFCDHVADLWLSLDSVYTSAEFKNDLVWTAPPTTGYGFTDSILKSGHHLFDSVLHAQVLEQLADMAEHWSCGSPTPMRAVRERIVAALNQGPLLWNDTVGMFMPSSGNNAHLTDVWGSALAVDSGAVTGERAARIVEWFGAHWAEVVQDGQVRHLPLGQHWAGHVFWEYDVYQNGGYWGTPSGWVLPVIARNSSAVAEQLVRDAISDCRRNGINEWHNNHYCSNCAGAVVSTPTEPGGLSGRCVPDGLGCQAYPLRGNWVGGAMIYGPNIGSVWRAAQRILPSGPAPAPPLPPPPRPPPPPITPPPAGCNITAHWQFRSLTTPGAFETNGFFEAGDGERGISISGAVDFD
jgi:hypothetical protein